MKTVATPSRALRPCVPAGAASLSVRGVRRGFRLRVATEEAAADPSITAIDAGDYYSILGVAPDATVKEIKQAYRSAMKSYHPDQSLDEEYNEFAVFLNQAYDTLMDADSRAEYDMIFGFTVDGKNPFLDTSYPPEYAFVDEFACIGCRNCNNVCPGSFTMEEVHGRARVYRQGADPVELVQEAMDTCPVTCIHWVTAPQLTLLEDTMAKMERVDTWLLMSSGGRAANLNVFFEASIAWEKRQSELRAREQRARWSWAPFAPAAGSAMQAAARRAAAEAAAASSSDAEDSGGASSEPPRRGKRVDAESIAAAARRWRDFQRAKRSKSQRLIGSASGAAVAAHPSN